MAGGVGNSWFEVELVSYPLLPARVRARVQPANGIVRMYATEGSLEGDLAKGRVAVSSKAGTLEPYVVVGSVVGYVAVGGVAGSSRDGAVAAASKSGTVVGVDSGGSIGHLERGGNIE